jgi:ketosteroid isomerase-like protein
MKNSPVQTPITGQEDFPHDEPLGALARFYRALNRRDLALMELNWASSDQVVMANPLGGVTRGWPGIRAIYERLFAGDSTLAVEFYDYTVHMASEIFYVVGKERGRFTRNDRTVNLAIRTTRVFQRIEGQWRQVHHHGSIDDARLLANYQDATR